MDVHSSGWAMLATKDRILMPDEACVSCCEKGRQTSKSVAQSVAAGDHHSRLGASDVVPLNTAAFSACSACNCYCFPQSSRVFLIS